MSKVPPLFCHLSIKDSDPDSPGPVRRDVRAELWSEGREEKMVLAGTLVGMPGDLAVQSIERDDVSLRPVDQREALSSLHDQIYGSDTKKVTLSFVDFEVETADSLVLHRVAKSLATAVWR